MSCPLCGRRKGKRSCPAKGELICAPCCGSKRRVQLSCPEDCIYLTGAHAPAWEGRETERKRDMRRFAAQIQGLSEEQSRLFLLALVGLTSLRSRMPGLNDRLLGVALSTLKKTVETRERGIVYEHQPDDMRAVAVIQEIEGIFQAKDASGGVVKPPDRDLLAVLEALDHCVSDTLKEAAGPTVLLDSAARLAAQFGTEVSGEAPEKPPSLILEP